MVDEMKWLGNAQRRAQEHSNKLFADWLQTKAGKAWKAKPEWKRPSPYHCGFSLPQYMLDLTEAMGEGDEARVKAIMMYEM